MINFGHHGCHELLKPSFLNGLVCFYLTDKRIVLWCLVVSVIGPCFIAKKITEWDTLFKFYFDENGGFLLKRFRVILLTIMYSFVCHYSIFQSAVYAQENFESSIDCKDVRIDYTDDPTLTREERIRLMDKAYYKSLNKFELCQSARKMVETPDGGATAASANGGSGGSGGSSGEIEDVSDSGSIASSTITGTELPTVGSAVVDNVKVKKSDISSASESTNTENSMDKGNISAANGKLPDDIPLANNDGALAAQIRSAAENEADPVKKEQLWNEYKKYKGLPQK